MADGDLGEGTRLAAATGAWTCFEDEAGLALGRGRARTWAPPRAAPRWSRLSGNSRPPVGRRAWPAEGRPPGRFFFRVRGHRRRKGEPAPACPRPTTPP